MSPIPGIIGAAAVVTVAVTLVGYLTWLDRRIQKLAARHAANLEAAVEAERRCAMVDDYPDKGTHVIPVSMELGYNPPSASMKPDATVAPLPAGDTLTLIGNELVHRRCVKNWADGEFHRVHARCRAVIESARGW